MSGSTQGDPFRHDLKIVHWDVKNKTKQTKFVKKKGVPVMVSIWKSVLEKAEKNLNQDRVFCQNCNFYTVKMQLFEIATSLGFIGSF